MADSAAEALQTSLKLPHISRIGIARNRFDCIQNSSSILKGNTLKIFLRGRGEDEVPTLHVSGIH